MRALQRVIRRFPSSDEAVNGARLEHDPVSRLPAGVARARVHSPRDTRSPDPSGRLRDVEALSLAPDGKLAVATRAGILVLDEKGAISRQAPSNEPRQLQFDRQNRLTIVQRSVILRETERGMQRVALTAATQRRSQAAAGHFGRRAAVERRAGRRRSRPAVRLSLQPVGTVRGRFRIRAASIGSR